MIIYYADSKVCEKWLSFFSFLVFEKEIFEECSYLMSDLLGRDILSVFIVYFAYFNLYLFFSCRRKHHQEVSHFHELHAILTNI